MISVCVCVCCDDIHLHKGDAERIAAAPQQRLTFRERLVIKSNSVNLCAKYENKIKLIFKDNKMHTLS